MFKRLPMNECIHHEYLYDEIPTLAEIIKDIGWGSNRLIRSGAVRVLDMTVAGEKEQLWKNWPIITDPFFKVLSGTMVGSGKIPKFVIIWVGDEKFYM